MADERDELDEVLMRYEAMFPIVRSTAFQNRIDSARSIRARERKLAELATWLYELLQMDIAACVSPELSSAERNFVRRYEEAVKDRARAEIGE